MVTTQSLFNDVELRIIVNNSKWINEEIYFTVAY